MRTQRGMSGLTVIFLLVVGGFILLCLFKVIPLYYNNYKLDSLFSRIGNEGTPIETQTTNEIRGRFSRQFQVEGINDVEVSDIEITRQNGEVTLSYIHEDRVNIFNNLDVVVSFENWFSTAEEDN